MKDEIVEESIAKHCKGLSKIDKKKIKMLTIYFIEHLTISALHNSNEDIDKVLKETKELFFENDKSKQSFEDVVNDVSKEYMFAINSIQ